MKVKTPRLISVNLSQITKMPSTDSPGKHWHPKISTKKLYLVKINGTYYVGTFDLQWYGHSFSGLGFNTQLDRPGTNSSMWQAIWEMRT